ncbi:hypothetical protein FB451DRAFT_1191825 [Mycena latifolia]|nr:hypothetical protein FB451DRAFT_1191825 [Mycena latifolia]
MSDPMVGLKSDPIQLVDYKYKSKQSCSEGSREQKQKNVWVKMLFDSPAVAMMAAAILKLDPGRDVFPEFSDQMQADGVAVHQTGGDQALSRVSVPDCHDIPIWEPCHDSLGRNQSISRTFALCTGTPAIRQPKMMISLWGTATCQDPVKFMGPFAPLNWYGLQIPSENTLRELDPTGIEIKHGYHQYLRFRKLKSYRAYHQYHLLLKICQMDIGSHAINQISVKSPATMSKAKSLGKSNPARQHRVRKNNHVRTVVGVRLANGTVTHQVKSLTPKEAEKLHYSTNEQVLERINSESDAFKLDIYTLLTELQCFQKKNVTNSFYFGRHMASTMLT